MHYFRVFKEQWYDRLYKLKCLGFNTVETYCAWNLHEKKEGVFDFSGMLDLVQFIKTATELGLYIIVRPGPYICSECDFGGLPAWLLKNESLRVRSDDPYYLEKSASLFDNLQNIGTHFESMMPRNMEYYGQDYGYILYRCSIPANMHINMLGLSNVVDRTHIFFNGTHRGTIYRNDELQYIESCEWLEEGGTLELLVENMGRVNFSPDIASGERKGICGYVYVMAPESPRQMLCDWDVYTLPMDDLSELVFNGSSKLPAFFKGSFKAEEKLDCFVHLDNFTKGVVFVNGFNLGRFWNVGPQLSLYLPAPLLKDENEIIVFEEEAVTEPVVSIRDFHIMNSSAKAQTASVTGVDEN